MFVHFFDGGRVKVVPGVDQFRDVKNLRASIEEAGRTTAIGQRVSEIFTPQEQAEIAAASEKNQARR